MYAADVMDCPAWAYEDGESLRIADADEKMTGLFTRHRRNRKQMKFHYGGKFKTDADFKSPGKHHEGAVAFREPSQKVFAVVANVGCIIVLFLLLMLTFFLSGKSFLEFSPWISLAAILSMLTLLPHEVLHAACFREDVYLYYDLSKLLVFVHGTESMSKRRFIFMSLLPNVVFGGIPFVLFLFNHNWSLLGMIGAFCISMGFGDYINVFTALTQMPRRAKTYLYDFHSYWYV